MYVIMCKVSVRMLSMRSTLSKHSSKIEPAAQKYEQSGCRCIFCLCVCVFFFSNIYVLVIWKHVFLV